jgi:2-polyprenyl-3-methyl-5-hydroxy-6-metoxy-1,4-benzoquinol methylase
MEFTGERLVLGKSKSRVENEHLARYRYASQLVKGKRVADIACGTGYGTQLLAKAGALNVHGMDLSEDAVRYCVENNNTPAVTYSVANAQNLTTIADGAFDIVVSFETIEHLPNVEAYLDEMVRVLRPGGTFLVSTPDRRIASLMYFFFRHPGNKYHVREYTERELLNLLSTRFQIKACYGQAFVPRWLVFWPVQFLVKSVCRILGTAKARDFKDNLYGNRGDVEVTPKISASRIPQFWVIPCVRLDKQSVVETNDKYSH